MSAKIIAEEGILKGQEFPIDSLDSWVVGRDPELSQSVLEDPSVSREHLLLKFTDDGVILENLSETSPAEVNDEPVFEPMTLKNGDSIRIGEGYYRFFFEEPAAEPTDFAEDEPSFLEDTEILEETETEEERDTIFEEDSPVGAIGPEIDLDLSDSAPWLLKVVSGPNNGAQFSMQPGMSYVIGSDPSLSDIVLHDVSVSKQHARLTLTKDNHLLIEDLGSSNGTHIESKKIGKKEGFSPNTLISVGTTSFIVYNREGARDTVISPLLPQIVRILQRGGEGEEEAKEGKKEEVATPKEKIKVPLQPAPPKESAMGSFLFASLMTGIVLAIGILALYLFQGEEVKEKEYDTEKILTEIFAPYKESVSYTFNPTTGRLAVVGHVLSNVQRNQILHDIESFPFIKSVDKEGLYVDELIKSEMNLIMSKDPRWKSVIIQTPTPGKFLISGYLETRKDADNLSDFLSRNFPFLDRLENRLVVEEYIENRSKVLLEDSGMRGVAVSVEGGEVILKGDIAAGKKPDFDQIVAQIKQMTGVMNVRPFITELPPKETLVDLSGQYVVSGSLSRGSNDISVVINGQVFSKGDSLDGRLITKIDPGVIFLEKGGVKYRIEYNR